MFYQQNGRTIAACKECTKRTNNNWYTENKDNRNAARRANYDPYKNKNQRLKCAYGITNNDYDLMAAEQDFACAICGDTAKLFVDHCHKTNKVRGLLCSGCNFGIGQFKDSTASLKEAINYLNK